MIGNHDGITDLNYVKPTAHNHTHSIRFALVLNLCVISKVLVFLYIYVWFRATLPRLRYDQLMDLGWKILIPASLGWFMLLAAQRLGRNEGWDTIVVTVASAIVLIVGYGLLQMALRVSQRDREREGSMF